MLDIMEIPRIGYLGTLGQSIVGKLIGSWGRPPIHSYSGSQGFTEAFHHHLLPYSAFHYLNWGGGRSVGSKQGIGCLRRISASVEEYFSTHLKPRFLFFWQSFLVKYKSSFEMKLDEAREAKMRQK